MASIERGFTIIEVILFLAISGLLLAGAIVGVNTNINNTRFNDAVNATTSYIQAQYDEVVSGRNDRADNVTCTASRDPITGTLSLNVSVGSPLALSQAPGMTNCVILGRYIRLQGSDFVSRYVVGYWTKYEDLRGNDNTVLSDTAHMKLIVANDTIYSDTYFVPWSVSLTRTTPSSSPASLGLIIVRSPVSGNVLYYSFPTTSTQPSLDSTVIREGNLNQPIDLCFSDENSTRAGHVKIASGQGQEVIRADFSDAAGDCS